MVANNLVAVGDVGDANMQAVYYNCGLFAYDTFAESLLTVNPMPGENVFQGIFQTFALRHTPIHAFDVQMGGSSGHLF